MVMILFWIVVGFAFFVNLAGWIMEKVYKKKMQDKAAEMKKENN